MLQPAVPVVGPNPAPPRPGTPEAVLAALGLEQPKEAQERLLQLVASDELLGQYRGLLEAGPMGAAQLLRHLGEICETVRGRFATINGKLGALIDEGRRATARERGFRENIVYLKACDKEAIRSHLLYMGRQLRLLGEALPSGVSRGPAAARTRSERIQALASGAAVVAQLIAPIHQMVSPDAQRNLELIRSAQSEADSIAWYKQDCASAQAEADQLAETTRALGGGRALGLEGMRSLDELQADGVSEGELAMCLAEIEAARAGWRDGYQKLGQASHQSREELEQLWWHHSDRSGNAHFGHEWAARQAFWAGLGNPG